MREIQRILDADKPTGYTIVLKLLLIMTDKELVSRDERARPQVYRALYSQERAQGQLLN